MKSYSLQAAGAAIALASIAMSASAQAQSVFVAANNNPSAQAGGIRYAAGGVGLDARAEMQGLAASHNVLIKFAEASGEYLVPDTVSVRQGNADVLKIANSGPLLYVNLPNGTYTVLATYQGVVRSKAITVAGRAPDLVLTWPVQVQVQSY
jgi:hypothetical protein